jgi:TetR/AcrR family transcriptional repressor of nem operon
MDRSTEHWRKQSEATPAEKRLSTIVNSYLSPLHRDNPGQGCAVPTLAAEIARESAKTRRAFSARMQQMLEMLAKQFHGVPPRTARKRAMAALATMTGSLVMARVAGSGEFSDEILKSGRDAILERAKPAAGKKSAKRTAASAWIANSYSTLV